MKFRVILTNGEGDPGDEVIREANSMAAMLRKLANEDVEAGTVHVEEVTEGDEDYDEDDSDEE